MSGQDIASDKTAAAPPWVGRPILRREDQRLLSGAGRFVADLVPPGALAIEVLRSPYPAGRIVRLDVAAARAAPGVRLVLTGADLAGLGASGINPLVSGATLHPMQPLAVDRVGAVGQPVAAVAALTLAEARDAVDLIDLEVEEDTPETPEVLAQRFGAAIRETGAITVRARVDHALVAPLALEPRAVVATWAEGALTAYLSTQTPQRCRDDLAAILRLDPDRVRVVAPDVGGAFGGKASLMPEDVICALAARALASPVHWTATRSDEFQAATQGRGGRTEGWLSFDEDGRLRSLHAEMSFALGHWMPYSALSPLRNAGRILPGPYAVPQVCADVRAHLSAGAAVNIYRGAGRPEAAILIERLMDKAARRLGIDPLALRRRNLLRPGDLPAANGVCSGDFAALLDRVEAAADRPARMAAQAARRAAGEVCGIGLALYVEPCGQGPEHAEARLLADGRILALTGASAQGQGRETAFAQLVADTMGVTPAQVEVRHGDTGEVPQGIGALASRSTPIGGSAMVQAAQQLLVQIRACVAPHLNAAPGTLVATPQGLTAPHGARLDWEAIAALAHPAGLSARTVFTAPAEAWASGAVLAEVAVDPDTGAIKVERLTWIDDAGHVINPLLVEGQLIGGAAQGLGATLLERMVYRDGQLVTGSLMDYALPRATDIPPMRLVSQPTPSPANPLGVKGVGEAGCIGVPAAILNAVQDAISPFTDADLSLPITSEQVWRAITGLEP